MDEYCRVCYGTGFVPQVLGLDSIFGRPIPKEICESCPNLKAFSDKEDETDDDKEEEKYPDVIWIEDYQEPFHPPYPGVYIGGGN